MASSGLPFHDWSHSPYSWTTVILVPTCTKTRRGFRHFVMLSNTAKLCAAIIAGVLVAVCLQPVGHLPSEDHSRNSDWGSTTPVFLDTMAVWLSKPLQMGQHVLRRVAYKSCQSAPSLPFCQTQTRTTHQTYTTTSNRPHSTTSSTMASTKTFLEAVKDRRTYYQLNKEAPKSDKEIVDIVNKLVLHVPSSFNSQSTRVVVLLNQDQ